MLTFEWILLVACLVVGLIGGLAGLRNALLDQLQDLENAVEAMNFSGTSTTTASTSATAQRALAKGSGVALVSDSGNSAKRIASGVQSQSEPGTLSLDTPLPVAVPSAMTVPPAVRFPPTRTPGGTPDTGSVDNYPRPRPAPKVSPLRPSGSCCAAPNGRGDRQAASIVCKTPLRLGIIEEWQLTQSIPRPSGNLEAIQEKVLQVSRWVPRHWACEGRGLAASTPFAHHASTVPAKTCRPVQDSTPHDPCFWARRRP